MPHMNRQNVRLRGSEFHRQQRAVHRAAAVGNLPRGDKQGDLVLFGLHLTDIGGIEQLDTGTLEPETIGEFQYTHSFLNSGRKTGKGHKPPLLHFFRK